MVELAEGASWGPFQIQRLLGRGDRGLLYRATQTSTGRSVALRIFDESLDEPTLNRFEDDSRRLLGLNHPNILRVEAVGREGKLRYLVTEYVEALSLRDCGPRPLRECCEIMLQTAKGLSAAWMRLILHRNLKPENILVTPRGEVKLSDFGLFIEPTAYWSPERKAGRSPDLRGDLFALGTIFREFLKEPDPGIAPLIDHLTKVEPFDRVQMVEDAISRLEAFLAKLPAGAAAPAAPAIPAAPTPPPPMPWLPPPPPTVYTPMPPPPPMWTPPSIDAGELRKARETFVSTLAAVGQRLQRSIAHHHPPNKPAAPREETVDFFDRMAQDIASPPPPPPPPPPRTVPPPPPPQPPVRVERKPQPPPTSTPRPAPEPLRLLPRKPAAKSRFKTIFFILLFAIAVFARVLKTSHPSRSHDDDERPEPEATVKEVPPTPKPPKIVPVPATGIDAEWTRTKEIIRKFEAEMKFSEASAECEKFVTSHFSDAPPESRTMRTELKSWSTNVSMAERFRKIGNGDQSLEILKRGGDARAKDRQKILDRWCEEDWTATVKEVQKAVEDSDAYTAKDALDRFLKKPHVGGPHKDDALKQRLAFQADIDFSDVSDKVQTHLRNHREAQAIEALEAFLALPHQGGTKREAVQKQISEIKDEVRLTLFAGRTTVNRLSLSPDGKRVAFVADGLKIVEIESHQVVWTQPTRSLVRLLVFGPDPLLASVMSNKVSLWDVKKNAEIRTLAASEGYLTGLVFSRDGKRAYGAQSDGSLATWEIDKPEPVQVDKAAAPGVITLALKPDGSAIAMSCRDKMIRIRTLANGLEHKWTVTGASASMLAWSPDGSVLAAAGSGDTTLLWDVQKEEVLQTLTGHKGAVGVVAFSPDGRRVATGGSDKIVRLWNVKDGSAAAALEGHRDRITGLVFAPGGGLISSSADGTVRIWPLKD